jgi:hypothetical protein
MEGRQGGREVKYRQEEEWKKEKTRLSPSLACLFILVTVPFLEHFKF